MTASTEQERAEFEAWAKSCGFDLGRDPISMGYIDCGTADAYRGWQAARRAQVVPQGWKLLPDEVPDEMVDAAIEAYMPFGDMRFAIVAALAAAHQPPEAATSGAAPEVTAPVQLPEPDEYQYCTRPTWDEKHPWTKWAKCSKEAAADYERAPLVHDWAYEVRYLYDGHQVRQLLALHGIK